jgi:protein gp37
MAETTGITWADATVNFWHGCKKVSEGCKYCYMFRDKEKYGQDGMLVKKTKLETVKRILKNLVLQDKVRKEKGITEPLKIFTCSWSDFFLDEADEWRGEAWDLIREHKEFIWIILTKRPERILKCLPNDWGEGWPHVWILVSAENQTRFNERVPILKKIPAIVKGVSIEPLIGYVDIFRLGLAFLDDIDWIIVGGESGNDNGKWLYRKCELDWIRILLLQCKMAGIAIFVKQLGTHIAKELHLKNRHGEDWDEWPEHFSMLKTRQFPTMEEKKIIQNEQESKDQRFEA